MPEDAQYLEQLMLEWRASLDKPRLKDAICEFEKLVFELEDALTIKIRNQYCEEDL